MDGTKRTRLLAACSAVLLAAMPAGAMQRRGSDELAPAPARAQIGLASYYGPGFEGDRTASGERFDPGRLTAAHRTLPFGTVVRVTNVENGRRVVVRVNDRGPFGPNRRKGCIIDLSKAAARRLGFVKKGLARVRVQILERGRRDR